MLKNEEIKSNRNNELYNKVEVIQNRCKNAENVVSEELEHKVKFNQLLDDAVLGTSKK